MKNKRLQDQIIESLTRQFEMKEKGTYLRQGRCPECGKKELYTIIEHPWVVKCGRLNNCGYEGETKNLFPELFEKLNETYKPTETNPHATADAYLQLLRGFNIAPLRGAYRQGSFYCQKTQKGTATVLFDIDRNNGVSMERFVETLWIPDEDGIPQPRKQHFTGSHRGLFWNNPRQKIESGNTVYIVEACLDAIALQQNGVKAVASLSCVNYPDKYLELYDPDKTIEWVWALDGDAAGKRYMKKYYKRMQDQGYAVKVALPPHGNKKTDWNDLHQLQKLTDKDMEEYLYQGSLLVAKNATDKALLIWQRKEFSDFSLEFDNRTFWFNLNLDKLSKAIEVIEESPNGDGKDEAEIRELAARQCGTLSEIANCNTSFLYYQRNELTDESWYYCRVAFPHHGKPVKNTFSGGQLSGAAEFKKRLLSIAPGAMFTGSSTQLDRIAKQQLFNIKTVDTIDYIGYSADHRCYIFNNLAVADGRTYAINDEDYFEIGKKSIKSLSHAPNLKLAPKHKYKEEWLDLVWQCFGEKGYAALAFWFGSFFAEQMREIQDSYPFLEVVGEPGSGKSTLLEFFWRLCGRDYEGFDPSKATAAARSRNMSQVANLPVVMLEGDRDDDTSHAKRMDWDELKTAYNGRASRSMGVKNSGNDTREPPFRAAIVITQNADVSASDAILQRIVHITFTRENHSPENKTAADRLARLSIEEVSYFLIQCVAAEKKVLDIVKQKKPSYEKWLLNKPEIKTVRIAHNHAQIMALCDAMCEVIGISDERREKTIRLLADMAKHRQKAIGADHPMVAHFWETFYYLDDVASKEATLAEQAEGMAFKPGLNHSKDSQLVAINLNEYLEVASTYKQQIPLITDLKKLLRGSRSHKFVDVKTVSSAITGKSKKCWVFEKGE